jgi:hypothetical protein
MVRAAMSIHHELHRARRTRERSLVTLALFAILVFTVVSGLVLAVLFLPNPSLLFAGRQVEPVSKRIVEIELGGARLRLPERLIARIGRTLLGEVERAELLIPWPYAPDAPVHALPSAEELDHLLMLTLEPAGGQKTHEEQLEPVYRVYFADRQAPRLGLQVHRFAEGAPYAGSEIIADYRETPPAALRCDLRPSLLGPILCDRVLRAGNGLVGRLRFSRSHAGDWKAIDGVVKQLLSEALRAKD